MFDRFLLVAGLIACFLHPAAVSAGTCDSGSDGSDGVFNPLASVQIDLSLAATANWDTPSPVPGQGVYDPVQWAVVFKYSSITIPNGVTVTFKNHQSGAPVVWLSQGDVLIDGTVSLNGASGSTSGSPLPPRGGPGGFDGGLKGTGTPYSGGGGFGPGGASLTNSTTSGGSGGGYGSQGAVNSGFGGRTYGNAPIIPLIGGSGGSGGTSTTSAGTGGAGGGAILIAAGSGALPAMITIGSTAIVSAQGGSVSSSGGGSGGAIRLVADRVEGAANRLVATAASGTPGKGRIRIDAIDLIDLSGASNPDYFTDGLCFPIFPESPPTLRVTQIDGIPAPDDPQAGIMTTDVTVDNPGQSTIDIEATGIPAGTIVKVRVVPFRGNTPECADSANPTMSCDSTPLVDIGGGVLTAQAFVTLPPGRTEIQLKANWTP